MRSAVTPMLRAPGSTIFSATKRGFGSAFGADRVVAHVLDAAGEGDVVHADADGAGHRRDARHGARAHAVDREPGTDWGSPARMATRAAEGQALVARLRGRRDRDIVDAVLREHPGCAR